MEGDPAESDVLCVEKRRQGLEPVTRQVNHVDRAKRSPSLVAYRLDLRVAHVQAECGVYQEISMLQPAHSAAAESQVESAVPRRRLVRVGQLVRQIVQRCGWTGDLEGIIVRAFKARTACRTWFSRNSTDELIEWYVHELDTRHTHARLQLDYRVVRGSIFIDPTQPNPRAYGPMTQTNPTSVHRASIGMHENDAPNCKFSQNEFACRYSIQSHMCTRLKFFPHICNFRP